MWRSLFVKDAGIWALSTDDVLPQHLLKRLHMYSGVNRLMILPAITFLVPGDGSVIVTPHTLALRLWWYSLHSLHWANTSQSWLQNPICSMEYSSGLTQALMGSIKIIKYFEAWTVIRDSPRSTPVNPITAIGVHI